jgi:hypothetical protein
VIKTHKEEQTMARPNPIFPDIRPDSRLDANDALKLAVSDERFAKALIREPEKFAKTFNLRDIEIEAIRSSVGHLATETDGGYE